MVRACNCRGMLYRAQEAFADRVRGWAGLRQHRPNVVAVHLACPECGKVWRMEFRALRSDLPDPAGGMTPPKRGG